MEIDPCNKCRNGVTGKCLAGCGDGTDDCEFDPTPTSLLVMYQGGGYDGCFWEWNFFAFDRDGKFFNIFTSGRDGVKTEDESR